MVRLIAMFAMLIEPALAKRAVPQAARHQPAAPVQAAAKQELVGKITSRIAGMSQHPNFRPQTAELIRLRSRANGAKTDPDLQAVRQDFEAWEQRVEPFLTGAASGPLPVVVHADQPAGQGLTPEQYNKPRLGLKAPRLPPAAPFSAPSGPDGERELRQTREHAAVHAAAARQPRAPAAAARRSQDLNTLSGREARRGKPDTSTVRVKEPPSDNPGSHELAKADNPVAALAGAVGGVLDTAGRAVRDTFNGVVNALGLLINPLKNAAAWVTSKFGWRKDPHTGRKRLHAGVDLRAKVGDPVQATGDGTVRLARWHGGYGKAVIIKHRDGLETLYGHLHTIGVVENQPVRAGMVIAQSGATGKVTGPHLHYETRRNGVPFDPMSH